MLDSASVPARRPMAVWRQLHSRSVWVIQPQAVRTRFMAAPVESVVAT
jgi:hypothetical protein